LKKTSRKGNDNFYQTVDLNIKILNRNKIWSIRELMESLQFDKAYVKELNNWESKTFEDNKDSKENKDNKGQNKK